jgi:hypothetical protein
MRVFRRRRLAATTLLLTAGLFAACDDDDPTGTGKPPQILGVQATATGPTAVRVTFNSRAGDNSFVIERAQGATATSFSQAGTAQAPATPGAVNYDDSGLTANTDYQYRVIAIRGSQQSDPSTAVPVKTAQQPGQTIEVTQDITSSVTWTKNNTYLLKGFIHVANGATLTIEAGTKVMGDFNTLGSSLFILRGARIQAVGTAAEPIVFTSSQPAGQRKPGDWGGLIIVGNATLSRTGVDIDVEGTGTDNTQPPSGKNYRVTYSGGNTDTDNSGELRYVRVEFAGYAPALNNELNSFTFAALGSGTRLSYLQTLAGLDDSFEWFGGTVSADHLVSYDSGDDHFDMSEGFRGRVQYIVGLQTRGYGAGDIRTGAGSASTDPQGIENDGCEGSGCTNGRNTTPFTSPVVANFTLVGTGDAASSAATGGVGLMLRRGTAGYYVNGLLARWPRAAVSIRDGETYVRAGSTASQDLATADLAVKNVLIVESAAPFQTGGSSTQNTLDLAGNAITSNTSNTTASLFTAFPTTVDATTTAAAFDWTPGGASPAGSGGLATFTGKLATAAGTAVTGTAYLGAAQPGGTKWWQGWTTYARN